MKGYLPLGLFRFLLSSLVFTSHARVMLKPIDGFMHFGQVGVLLFFVVSGLFIFSAYYTFYADRPLAFLANRALRIYPMLWAAYGTSIAVILLLDGFSVHEINLRGLSPQSVFLALTAIAANLDGSGAPWSPLQVAWSIHVELKFYVIAVSVIVLARMLDKKHVASEGVVLGVVGGIFIAAYALVVATQSHYRFFGELKFAPFFVLGACLYFLLSASRMRIGTAVLTGVSGLAVLHYLLSTASGEYGGFRWNDFQQNATTATFFVLLAVMLTLLKQSLSERAKRIDKWFGDVTYPLYFFHLIVISVVVYLWAPQGLAAFVGTYAACVATSALMFLVVDRPIGRMRTHFRGRELRVI